MNQIGQQKSISATGLLTMKILFTVQRYGLEINGGAEQACRWLAEGLASRGHNVEVITSCALDYMTWADHYAPGSTTINAVLVHRLRIKQERNVQSFDLLSARVDFRGHTSPLSLEDQWLKEQGPDIDGFNNWLENNYQRFDIVFPFTYLYRTAQDTISTCAGKLPIAMHATAHDESQFYLRRIKEILQKVDFFFCYTKEEMMLLQRTVVPFSGSVVGAGVNLLPPKPFSEVALKYAIQNEKYFVVLGRIDGNKGTPEVVEVFSQWRSEMKSTVNLLVVGAQSSAFEDLPQYDGVIYAGYVDEAEKTSILANSLALIQPSIFESFSLVLCEAWLSGTATLANGRSDVLVGQTNRSGGGLLYHTIDGLKFGLDQLSQDQELRRELATSGQQFVHNNYGNTKVLQDIELELKNITVTWAEDRRPAAKV